MKSLTTATAITLMFSIFIAFSSCKRNDPVPEVDQEEYDSAEIVFTNLLDPSEIVKIIFDKEGKTNNAYYSLTKNEHYSMQITLYNNGKSINQEIIDDADEHKFFFLAPANGVTAFTYKDNDLGLKGEISFGDLGTDFAFTIVLRHGLNKTHSAAKMWNSTTYQEAGGVDDLRLTAPLRLISEGQGYYY